MVAPLTLLTAAARYWAEPVYTADLFAAVTVIVPFFTVTVYVAEAA